MPARQSPAMPLPDLWLFSDERNDAVLEEALATMPKGSGFVFRHYHLEPAARRERFDQLGFVCRLAGHLVVLSGDSDTALEWGADGVYGPARKLRARDGLLRLATVHDLLEISRAERHGVDAMFLSPVFPTRSHPDRGCLGKENFLFIAGKATRPIIALGGMNAERAEYLGWPRWGAIDGLS
jgi:thiamine-phosphate pyrophosphorylase